MTELNVHHRKPRSLGGSNTRENCVTVPVTQHQAWHTLFHNYDVETIARIINTTWLDPEFEFILKRRK